MTSLARWWQRLSCCLQGYGCRGPQADFSRSSEEFVFTTLAFSPVTASAAGLHRHAGKHLDGMLDDYSAAAIERQRQWYSEFRNRIEHVRRTDLSVDDQADLDIIQDQISLALAGAGGDPELQTAISGMSSRTGTTVRPIWDSDL